MIRAVILGCHYMVMNEIPSQKKHTNNDLMMAVETLMICSKLRLAGT